MSFLKNKTIQLLIAVLSIAGYGVFVFAATPPAGGFAPGLELDPTCTPGHSIDNGDPYDCFVKQAWQQNVADGFVYNVDDMVGIGTDTPGATLDVLGDLNIQTDFSGGTVLTQQGDLSAYGSDYGFVNFVGDDISIPSSSTFGLAALSFNSGDPAYSLFLNNGTNLGGLSFDTSTGEMELTTSDADSSARFYSSPGNIAMAFNTLSTQNDGDGTPLLLYTLDENERGGGFSARTRNTSFAYAGADMFVWDDALGGDRTAFYLNEREIKSFLRLDPDIANATNETNTDINEMNFWFHRNDPTLANESKYIIDENFEWTKPTTLGSLMFLDGATGNLGIGTDTPDAKLDVVGDLNIFTSFTGGFAFTKQGDLSEFGREYGFANVVSDGSDVFGVLGLDFNSGSPLYDLNLDNGTNTVNFNLATADGKVTLSSNAITEGINLESISGSGDGSDFRLHRGSAEMAVYDDGLVDDEEGPHLSLYTSVNSGGCTDAAAACAGTVGTNNGSGSIILTTSNLHGQTYNNWFNATEDGLVKFELNANGNAGAMSGADSRATYIDIWYDARTSGNTLNRKFGIGTCGGDMSPDFGCLDLLSIGSDHNIKIGADIPAIGEFPRYALFPHIDTLTELNTRPEPVISAGAFDGFNGGRGSAMVYSYESKNLFFYTTFSQGGTDAWQPVSPFERGTNETHLFDDTDLVGLGTIATTDKLEVFGDIRVGTSSTNGCLKDFSGGTITGTCSSDERLKTNIQPVTDILEKFTDINLVTYDWNSIAESKGFKGNTSQLGVLAQNIEQSFPDLVVTDSDGYKQVNYARLNLLSIAAIKELNVKMNAIETIASMQNSTFKNTLIAWFADVTNGIGDLFADNVHAKNTICIDDVCLTKDQLRAMISNVGSNGGGVPVAPDPDPVISPAPSEPDLTPVPDPVPDNEPVVEPEPEIVPESEPVIEEVPSESPVSEVI